MNKESIPKTAFTCHLSLFEFVRLPLGLTNASAIFQRTMNKVLTGLIGRCYFIYIDDIVVFSKNHQEHAQHLHQIFKRFRDHGLQFKSSKCDFGRDSIDLLSFRVTSEGVSPLPDRVKTITRLEPPTSQKEIRSFLGIGNHYRDSIYHLAEIACPLTELTKKNEPFIWTPECQQSFEKLRTVLTEVLFLALPDGNRPYTLHTDASDCAMGAVLSQTDDYGKKDLFVSCHINFQKHSRNGQL